LIFQPGEAFQFDRCEDFAVPGGARTELPVAHIKRSPNLWRFGAGPLMTYCAAKEKNHGHRQVGCILQGYSADRAESEGSENSLADCFLLLLTFIKAIRAELIWRRTGKTRRQAETAFGPSFGPMALIPHSNPSMASISHAGNT
jgi:hypothetical protein